MNGNVIKIHGLSFDSALKICTTFDDYTVLNRKKSFFHDGEVALELKKGYYRVTILEEYLYIEELNEVINEIGKLEWKVAAKISISSNSYSYIEIK